jgi:hypothetical protein
MVNVHAQMSGMGGEAGRQADNYAAGMTAQLGAWLLALAAGNSMTASP